MPDTDFAPPPVEDYVEGTGFTPPSPDEFVPPHPSTEVKSTTPFTDRAVSFLEHAGVPTSIKSLKETGKFLIRSPIQDVKDIAAGVAQIPERIRNIGQTLRGSPAATVARAPLSTEAFGVYGTAAGMLAPGIIKDRLPIKGGEVTDASQVTGAEGVPEPDVRTQVGEETPLRQQGETPEAQQKETVAEPFLVDQEGNVVEQGGESDAIPLSTPESTSGETAALKRPDSSWMIRNKDTGEIVMETYDPAKVKALNTKKYEAVHILDYLRELNEPTKGGEQREVQRSQESGQGQRGETGPNQEKDEGGVLSLTSIKNEIVDRERSARGLPPVVEPLRKSFGEAWDNATRKIDQDPQYPDQLLDELRAKPRALTDEEDATLLHRQVDLQNRHAKASQEILRASESGDEASVTENKVRMAQLNDQLLDLYNVGKQVGTESGRGLAARQMLAAEDFSLANMMTEKRANLGGKPLTPEQEAEVNQQHQKISASRIALDEYETGPQREAYRKRLKILIADYQKRTASGDFAKRPKVPMVLDKNLLQLKANLEQAKSEFWQGMTKDRMAQRSPQEKVQDTFTKWRRAFLLSGPNVLAKLTSAAFERMAFTPMEEVTGGVLGKIPGVSKVMKMAPRQGGLSTKAEARAITEGFTTGMRDSWDTLKSGRSAIDLAYGPRNILPKQAVDFMGQVHGALKAPVKRNEFARTFEKLVEKGIANGVDVTDPLVQTRYGVQAYKEANRSIFLQDNRVVDFYKRGLSALDQPSKVTGKVPVGSKIGSTAMRVLFPIVKVPTNIVAETMQYSTGLLTGSMRLANAFRKGIDTLPPEHADLIARELKKGSVGGAVMLLGFLNSDKVGGYFQRGQKRGKEDVGYGKVKVFGTEIPPYLIHNPLLEQLQIGATVRRVAESKLRKKDTSPQGIPMGILAAGLGVTEEVPFVRETLGELPKIFNPRERQQFLGDFAKSILVPQAVQWAAAHTDKSGDEYVKRQADTILESIESGIPRLRKTLPVKTPYRIGRGGDSEGGLP